MKLILFFVFLFLFCLNFLFSQKIHSVESGFKEYIPKANNQILKNITQNNIYVINQSTLWRQDSEPFPFLFPGILIEYLVHQDKISYGIGYDYFADFHNFSFKDTNQNEINLSSNLVNQSIYLKGLLHLKDQYRFSPFLGIKGGLSYNTGGFSQLISSSNNTTSLNTNIPFTLFSPGAFISFLAGVKIYFWPKLFGFRMNIEYILSTPSFSFYKNNIIDTTGTIVSEDRSRQYQIDASGLMINFIFFAHLKPLF